MKQLGCLAIALVAVLVAGALMVGVAGIAMFGQPEAPKSNNCVGGIPPAAAGAPVATDGASLPSWWDADKKGAERAANVGAIIATGRALGFSDRGLVVGIATAIQESRLLNLDYGDRDSLGLFQQRPSMGWGTPAQVRDPVYASTKFFEGLRAVPGWESLPVTVAAQRVQRSGFPDAYAQWERLATALVTAAGGQPLQPAPLVNCPPAGNAVQVGEVDPNCPGGDISGYSNGQVPSELLCPLLGTKGHVLRADAANAFNKMTQAYQAHFGEHICVTDSYRPYSVQVRLKAQKPGLAATPGRSNHGWAKAVDLCGGANSFGTPQHEWLRANAPRFGWCDPPWARRGGSKPEAWHWEYDNPQCGLAVAA